MSMFESLTDNTTIQRAKTFQCKKKTVFDKIENTNEL